MIVDAHMKRPDSQRRFPAMLIVDDHAATLRGLCSLFLSGGYQPASFQEGLTALTFAREHRPAGAIIDINLPDISGLLVSKKLREILGPYVPIVMFSGDASMEVLNSLPEVGATYFFQKPVNGSLLLQHFFDQLHDVYPLLQKPGM